MNILQLNYEYPPLGSGGASVCRDIAERLSESGHKVSVVTMHMKGLRRFEIVNGVRVYRVMDWRTKAKVCHPWEQLSYCISAYFFIKKNIDIKEYDAIHCHFIVPTGLIALWLKKRFKIEYVLTAQGSDVIGHNNKRFKYLYKLIFPIWVEIIKNAKYLTAPSSYLVNEIYKSYRGSECRIIPNGISLEKYSVSKKKKVIVTLSRLQESKGIQDLLEVLKEIRIREWRVYIIGTGPYKEKLKKIIELNDLEKSVTMLGYVSDDECLRYLSEAGLYFSGSRFEAMPVSVLEAMASGCKIIASDIEPHRQLFSSQSIYTDLGDLKSKIQHICDEEPTSVTYELEEYDWKNIIKKYMEIYK